MLTRCAFFEGHVRADQETAFDQFIAEHLMPLWLKFPGAVGVRLQRRVSADPIAPHIHMTLEFDYPSEAIMNGAVSSPIRAEAKAKTDELLAAMFDGRLYHIVFERAD